MILPSKKVLSLFILATALVTSIILAFGKEKSGTAINFASNLVAGDKISIPENPDWQNELGQVTISGNDLIAKTEETAQTTTDIVSTSIASNYLVLKQSGALDQESAQKLIDQNIDFINQNGEKIVATSELNVISDNGLQTITEYGENLGTILRKNRPAIVKNEVEIITKALETNDQSKIEELQEIIIVYNNITNDLLKMKVPKTFVKAHLDMINGSKGITLALKKIQGVFGDPIQGLPTLQIYSEGANILTKSLQATSNFIVENKVVYKQGSGGYYLLYGI